MRVKVSGRTVEIFSGACVRDAVRKHSPDAWNRVRENKAFVFDRRGYDVAPDGELAEGDELFVRRRAGRTSR